MADYNSIYTGEQIDEGVGIALAQPGIDAAQDAEIAKAKDTLTDYAGLVYSGKPTNNEILFTTENVAAGDVLYYSMEMSVGQLMGVLLMDSNNNRIGFFGRNHATLGWLEYEGAIIVPENFDHAVAQVTRAGTVKINYICKNPSPEMIRRHLHNLLDAFNYGKEYIYRGHRLRISDGAASSSSKNSITGYYSVLPGDVITVSDFIGTSGYGIGFYDVNQQFLYGRQSGTDTMTIVVPDNVFYIRYTVLNTNSAQIVNIYRGSEIVEKCGRLYKKKAVTFGDSITYWDGRVFNFGKENGVYAIGYQSYMRACGMEVINKGVAGYDMTEMNPVIKNTDYTGVDIVTITSGANDSKDNVPLGAIADIGSTFDTSTFYGALQDAIEYIYTQSKTIEIVLITPIKGTYPNGKVKQEFAEAIKEVGSLYGLPVCDWYNNSGINELTFDVYINDLPESHTYMLHPTRAGYKRMADILIPFLKSIGSDEIKKTFL